MMFSNIVIFLLLLALISFCDLVSLPGNERKSMVCRARRKRKERHNMELSIVLPLAVILLDNRKTILCQTTTSTIASL